MNNFSRRNFLASMAITGVAALGDAVQQSDGAPGAGVPVGQPAAARRAPLSPAARKAAAQKLVAYFHKVASQLLRPAQGILRHPSVSPSLAGKAYSTQLWDWDTLWTSRGLFRLAQLTGDHDLLEKVGRHARGSLLNFLEHQSEDGRIAIMIDVANPDPLGCLKKTCPNIHNQAKPVFSQLALLVADQTGDVQWLAPQFENVLHFYDSWELGNQAKIGLLVWGDDVGIGDDNDPTTFGRPYFSSANMLLNSLYYEDLRAAAELARRLHRPQDQKHLTRQADEQGRRMQQYCWDSRDRFYYTVDVQCKDRRAELLPGIAEGMPMSWQCLPLRIQMFTGFLPMWCSLATPQQAADLVKLHYLNDQTFHAAYGVRSLSKQETMYSLARSGNPSNWLGPIWIIANYFVWKGLKNYGYKAEAANLADKTLRLLASDLATSGSLNEYYDPDTGAPLSHQGFVDWNMLVLEMV